MVIDLQLTLSPAEAHQPDAIRKRVANELNCVEADITHLETRKRSIDARGRHPKYLLQVRVHYHEPAPPPTSFRREYPYVANRPAVIIIGARPWPVYLPLCG